MTMVSQVNVIIHLVGAAEPVAPGKMCGTANRMSIDRERKVAAGLQEITEFAPMIHEVGYRM